MDYTVLEKSPMFAGIPDVELRKRSDIPDKCFVMCCQGIKCPVISIPCYRQECGRDRHQSHHRYGLLLPRLS